MAENVTRETGASVEEFLQGVEHGGRREDALALVELMRRVGFSPRKGNPALYFTAKGDRFREILPRLGKHKMGGSCLYVTRLSNVDLGVLEELVAASWARAGERWGEDEGGRA